MIVGHLYVRTTLVILSLLGLAACTVQPIKTAPPSAVVEKVRQENRGGQAPAILSYCYSGQLNEPAQVLEYAREDCPAGKLFFQDDDVLWTKCPLIQPVRATFLCYPADPAGPANPADPVAPEQSLAQ